MPLQATSGAASYDAFGGGVAAVPNYIEECFSTYLYTGNGSTQTITNGIDLSTKGGLVWIKCRNSASDHSLEDTLRTVSIYAATINSNTTSAQSAGDITGFTTSGFSLRDYTGTTNANEDKYVSWTLRKQPKFFDVVTWTGDDSANRQISHSLGSVPGCIIVKRTDTSATWRVWHQNMVSNPANLYQYQLNLNTTDAVNLTYGEVWGTSNNVTSTTFQVGSLAAVNASGGTYVAYVFAHNAGGFGLTGTDNVISCGSYTGNGSTSGPTITLGYEPQWVLIKEASASGNQWVLFDNMRGMPVGSNDNYLFPNLSNAESSAYDLITPTATGFSLAQSLGIVNASGSTYIYIAIRRGPMKVPTSGTSVFNPFVGSDTSSITTNFPVDMLLDNKRAGNSNNTVNASRLVGVNALITSSTVAEAAGLIGGADCWQSNVSYLPNALGTGVVSYAFRRAPSFFDEVCYTGTGSVTTFSHNLGVVPELMIVRRRSAGGAWMVNSQYLAADARLELQSTSAVKAPPEYGDVWNNTRPTSTVFTVSTDSDVNASGGTYVNYLFATCAGVSKVGSYTGTGTTKQIDCGFTGGARFVLIKKTSGTGSWYVWDSARGIVSGNDPYLLLNSTAAEVTSTDYIDTYSAGFEISSTAPSEINENGGSFIFLAIS